MGAGLGSGRVGGGRVPPHRCRPWGLLALALLAGCRGGGAPPPPPPVPVNVAPVVLADFPTRLSATGHVEPFESVEVKAQVAGILTHVGFSEGDDVRKGQVLFRLDRRPFETALAQAEANLARDQAQLDNARLEEKRYLSLAGEGLVPQEQADQVRAAAGALKATVDADCAAIESARVQLTYTTITAPLSGRAGNLSALKEGNLVKAQADAPLVVIHRIQPVNVSFAVPEQALSQVRGARARGPVAVEALPFGAPPPPERGTLSFIDNQVDAGTGTVLLKGTFPNPGLRLWPGQSVTASVTVGVRAGALVIPSAAVQSGQKGEYVYVVRPDGTAEYRTVVLTLQQDADTVVESGLSQGEVVVTDGQIRLTAGARVAVRGTPMGLSP